MAGQWTALPRTSGICHESECSWRVEEDDFKTPPRAVEKGVAWEFYTARMSALWVCLEHGFLPKCRLYTVLSCLLGESRELEESRRIQFNSVSPPHPPRLPKNWRGVLVLPVSAARLDLHVPAL